MWLTVSFLSLHNLHLKFCYGLSVLPLTSLVLMALFWYQKRFSFSKFPYFSYVLVIRCAIILICRLKYPFFHFCCFIVSLFGWHCYYWLLQLVFLHSFWYIPRFLHRCNPQCWRLLFLLFSWHIESVSVISRVHSALCMATDFLLPWSICLSFSFVHFKNGPSYLTKMFCRSDYSFDEISAVEFDFEKRSCFSKVIFSYFFLSLLFVLWCLLPIFPGTLLIFFSTDASVTET